MNTTPAATTGQPLHPPRPVPPAAGVAAGAEASGGTTAGVADGAVVGAMPSRLSTCRLVLSSGPPASWLAGVGSNATHPCPVKYTSGQASASRPRTTQLPSGRA